MTNSIWEHLHSVLSPSSEPIRVVWTTGLQDGRHPAIAGADIRRRELHLDKVLRRNADELRRIVTHEAFHFVWVRLGNPKRSEWKDLLHFELAKCARGELGWSSEWRKMAGPGKFGEYAAESFCDTAAWLYSGVPDHREFTLARRWRARRRAWFEAAAPFRW